MRKVQISSSVNIRVDDHISHGFVARSLACDADDVVVFLQHIHCLTEVGGILEKCAAAQFVQVILSDIRDVLGAYLVQHSLCLDRTEVNVSETVSVYRLFTEILAYLDSVT